MNKIERIKTERDGLDIKKDIERFAEEGWESISEEDIQRLKWYGVFLRNPTPGYFMCRVRISNGFLFSHQTRMLADIAQKFGNGILDFTTRMSIQLRGLRIENIPEIFNLMESVGLNSLQTGMDNVRTIIGCPLAGIHPKEAINAAPLIFALTQSVLNDPEFSNLPRKFNVAITGCPDNCVHAESQDLALVPARHSLETGDETIGFNIKVGGKLGSGGYRVASDLDMFVLPDELVEVCLTIIRLFRDNGSRENRTQNRLAFLVEEWGVDRFRFELIRNLRRSMPRAGEELRNDKTVDHIGVYRQKQPMMNSVGLKIPVGRVSADELTALAELSERYGKGETRIMVNQGILIPFVSDRLLGDMLEEKLIKKFSYSPTPAQRNLVSCVGSDYCSMATIETKSRAVELATALDQRLDNVAPVSMHWSGCPAGCGNHLLADIGFLGKRARVDGQTVDAVDVFMGGRAGPFPVKATKVLENVPCDRLPAVMEAIIPFHSREKMHPIKKGKGRGRKPKPEEKTKQKETEPETVPA